MRLLALAAALTAAATLPHAPIGLNAVLVSALVAATAATALRASWERALLGGLALLLAGMAAVRDAGWIVALDLGAAWTLGTLAVAGHHPLAPIAPLLRLPEVPELAPAVSSRAAAGLRGVALGSAIVVPFAALFWTADAVFAELGRSTPLPSLETMPARAFTFGAVLVAALGLALAAGRALAPVEVVVPRRLEALEWAIPLALLNALFLAFVGVQLSVLFGSDDYVLRTVGLTYAEYAREGFWQLLAVAALTLVVVAAAVRLAGARGRADKLLLRGLLGVLCALTIVVVASALHRLRLYEDAFGLTRLRLAAETFAWGLGGLFALLLVAGALRLVRGRLVQIAVTAGAAGLLAFSLSDPDRRIAQRNVDRWRETGKLDVAYAQGLSADAVPALARLPSPLRDAVLAPYSSRLTGREPWASFNLSRHRARRLLAVTE